MGLNEKFFKSASDTPIVPTDHFNTVTWAGDNTAKTIPVGFQPDLIWLKNRNNSTYSSHRHLWYDSVRGVSAGYIHSDGTSAQESYPAVSGFASTGFNLPQSTQGSTEAGMNDGAGNGTYVAWCWKAGATTTTIAANTVGNTIASDVRANVDAGFSIVKHTGTGAVGTVGHGLDSAPELIIYKQTSSSSPNKNWIVYASPLGNTGGLLLNVTNSKFTDTDAWNNTTPTSTVFSLGAGDDAYESQTNVSGKENIAYCFHSVDGYSKIGSYTGTGNASNITVSLGFSPRFLMVKKTNATSSWLIMDAVRNPSSPFNTFLLADGSGAEFIANALTFSYDSTSFTVSNTDGTFNANGGTYIYLAIA